MRNWTNEDIAEIEAMKAKKLTRQQIAEHFGSTIGGIAGALARHKAKVLGLPPRIRKSRAKSKVPKVTMLPTVTEEPKIVQVPLLKTLTITKPEDGYTIDKLPYDRCHYAIGNSPEGTIVFCGRPGAPWCPEHRRVVYPPPGERRPIYTGGFNYGKGQGK
jgi:hypothetical protein